MNLVVNLCGLFVVKISQKTVVGKVSPKTDLGLLCLGSFITSRVLHRTSYVRTCACERPCANLVAVRYRSTLCTALTPIVHP